jgi:hypothetical protein
MKKKINIEGNGRGQKHVGLTISQLERFCYWK